MAGVETDAQSAYDGRERPAWHRVLAAVERAEVEVVLAWHLDRMTRSMLDLECLITLAEASGVGIATVSGDIDLTTDAGRMVARILAAVARAEVERKGARQRLANRQRASEGKPWPSGPRLFGYEVDGSVIEVEADAIQTAARDVLAGTSCYSIAKKWAASGLSSASRRGRSGWTPAGVKVLLVNPRLAGIATYQGAEIGRGTWEPILDEASHIQLKAALLDPARRSGSSRSGPKPTTLLSTVAKCGKCGKTVQAGVNKGKQVYTCRGTAHVVTSRAQADMFVRARVVEYLAHAAETGALKVENTGSVDLVEVDTLRERLNALATSFATGTITHAQLEAGTEVLRAKIAEAEASARPEATVTTLDADKAVSMWLDASVEGQRAMLAESFEVMLHPRGRGRRDVPIWEYVSVTLKVG